MNKEERYSNLKKELDTINWPNFYLYKFILKTEDESKINIIKNNFKDLNPEIYTNISKKGTFISISIKVNMKSSDAVIEKYKNLEDLDGIMSL